MSFDVKSRTDLPVADREELERLQDAGWSDEQLQKTAKNMAEGRAKLRQVEAERARDPEGWQQRQFEQAEQAKRDDIERWRAQREADDAERARKRSERAPYEREQAREQVQASLGDPPQREHKTDEQLLEGLKITSR